MSLARRVEQPAVCLGRLGLELPCTQAPFVGVALGDEEHPLASRVGPRGFWSTRVSYPTRHLPVGGLHEAVGVRLVRAHEHDRRRLAPLLVPRDAAPPGGDQRVVTL